MGYEYELLRQFAGDIGVTLKVVVGSRGEIRLLSRDRAGDLRDRDNGSVRSLPAVCHQGRARAKDRHREHGVVTRLRTLWVALL